MALTVNNFTGFETQGNEEAGSVTGSVSYPIGNHRSGNVSLLLDASFEEYDFPWTETNITDAGNDYIIGFAIKFTGTLFSDNATPVVSVKDSAGSDILAIHASANASFLLDDANGSQIGNTANNTILLNRWYYLELYFQHADPANIELFIDGVSVISETNTEDLTHGNSINSSAELVFKSGINDVSVDDVYILSGATSASDRLGSVEVYMKQGAQTGVTPDISNLSDDDLDEGTWALASETPLNEQSQAAAASYTGGAAAGVVYADGSGDKLGPAGDNVFTGATIKAMKGIWRMARSGGGGTAQFGEIGNDGGAASDIETTADLNLTTGYINYFYVTEIAATLPTLSEHAAIGFSKNGGGQDLDVAEMWAMILSVPGVPSITDLADAEWPDQNYHVGPFEI